jgi:hypothetical protein
MKTPHLDAVIKELEELERIDLISSNNMNKLEEYKQIKNLLKKNTERRVFKDKIKIYKP